MQPSHACGPSSRGRASRAATRPPTKRRAKPCYAEAAFVHAFCRDRSLLLGVEGYALTSLEVALATPPRPDDAVPMAPVPAPPTAVAA